MGKVDQGEHDGRADEWTDLEIEEIGVVGEYFVFSWVRMKKRVWEIRLVKKKKPKIQQKIFFFWFLAILSA